MIKKGSIIKFLIIALFIFISLNFVKATDISACQALSSGNTYNLTANITASANSTCFTGAANNVVVDCNGHTIFGNATAANKWAFFITGYNLRVSNCVFDSWNSTGSGPAFETAENSTWKNITLKSNGGIIRFYTGSSNSTIINLTIENGAGILTYGTADNITISEGLISGNLTTSSGRVQIQNMEIDGNIIVATNITIENSNIHNVDSEISFSGTTTNLTNVTFYNNTFRTNLGIDTNVYLNQITRINNTGSTFSLGADSPNNLEITNSIFEDENNLYVYLSSGSGMVNNALIHNNTFNRTNSSLRFVLFNNSVISNNRFQSTALLMEKTNYTNITDNWADNSTIYTGGTSASGLGHYLKVYNNYFQNMQNYALDIENTFYSDIWNNTGYNNNRCITVAASAHNSLWNNTCKATSSSVQSHGILINSDSTNITVFSNYVENASYGYLFEYGTYNSSINNNQMIGGGIFYSLHGTHDNIAHDNYIEGDLILHDNVTRENFYNNTFTGNLVFRWDLVINPSGMGAFNNTIQDSSFGGNLTIEDNSTDNILINVTWDGEENIDANNISSYIRKWYLGATSDIVGTNITLSNSTSIIYSALDSNFTRQTLLAYTNTGGTEVNETYNLTATAPSYGSQSEIFNLTQNLNFEFTFNSSSTDTSPTSASISTTSSIEEIDAKGYLRKIYSNRDFNFKIEGEIYKIRLTNFDKINNTVTLNLYPGSQMKNLSIGEEWKIDINNDTVYDLQIQLKNQTSTYIEIFIKKINEEISSDNALPEMIEEQKITIKSSIWSIIVSYLKKFLEIFWHKN